MELDVVRENFRRVAEFGWFLPEEDVVLPTGRSDSGASEEYKRAAVLFLIGYFRNELHVLITKRSDSVRRNKGDNCLPGGMQEDGDRSLADTALRESWEEVHLDPSLVEIVTVTPPFLAGFLGSLLPVCAVVGILQVPVESLSLTPNDEVEYMFWAPLRMFVEGRYHTPHVFQRDRVRLNYHVFDYVADELSSGGRHHVIWGLTANICIAASSIAVNQSPYFPFTLLLIHKLDNKVILREIALTVQQVERYGKSRLIIPRAKL